MSKAFTLADYAITYDYKITNIAFGVETATAPNNVNFNVYSLIGVYPGGWNFYAIEKCTSSGNSC
ncbi:hypothetical protein [Chryseobacterium sp. MP_3.2]|uniref:hypothetical protein n=1 Tax=Chryseobacterium sp. MP_3.2 TaxID=3071712 RepID=UPI002E04128C|nr:hypothetical protein [Chryseobacterium sp. MP_3.2]